MVCDFGRCLVFAQRLGNVREISGVSYGLIWLWDLVVGFMLDLGRKGRRHLDAS